MVYQQGNSTTIEVNPLVDQNNARFEAQMNVTASCADDFIRYAIHYLRNCGYEVIPPNEKWETPKQFTARLHICKHGLKRALCKYDAPICKVIRSKTGRILSVLSNAAFDKYCKRHDSTPG